MGHPVNHFGPRDHIQKNGMFMREDRWHMVAPAAGKCWRISQQWKLAELGFSKGQNLQVPMNSWLHE